MQSWLNLLFSPIALSVTLIVSLLSACSSSTTVSDIIATDDQFNVLSGVTLEVDSKSGVLGNDTGSGLHSRLISNPQFDDSFSFREDGSFTYNALVNNSTDDQFIYEVVNTSGDTAQATVTLTITPSIAISPDKYALNLDSTLSVSADNGVLANDLHNRNLKAELVSSPSHASFFTFNQDGSFTYSSASFTGADTFSYRAIDNELFSAPVEVTLFVKPLFFSGLDDRFSIESGKTLKLTGEQGILFNDARIEDDVKVVVKQLPEHAIDFSLNSDGDLIYRTVSPIITEDRFTYTIANGQQTLGPYVVEITISQPLLSEKPPDAFDQCSEYDAGSTISSQLTSKFLDAPTFELLSNPRLGELTAFDPSNGLFSYSRHSSARGQDSFSYKIFNKDNEYVGDATQQLIAVPYRILPAGDSITAGVELYNGVEDTPPSNLRVGYRKFLKDSLTNAGYSIDFVGRENEGFDAGLQDSQHEGHSGRDDLYVRDNMEEWLIRQAPDIVLLHIGTNLTKDNPNNIQAIADIIDQWEETNHPLTLMMAKIAQRIDDQVLADLVTAFNEIIEKFINTRKSDGDRIFKVDQFSALGDGEYLGADQVHPTLTGYEIMAATWHKRLINSGTIKRCQ